MVTEKYIQIDKHTIYVKTWDAENSLVPIVFLHDSWGCVEMWKSFPEQIFNLTNRTCILYDRIGYGKSSSLQTERRTKSYFNKEAEILNHLLKKLKLNKVFLYGHSDGATISLMAASIYPDMTAGLLLEGPHSFIEDSGKDAVRASRDRAKHTSLLSKLESFHGNKTALLFRLWHETWLSNTFADWSIVSFLKNIHCPVLAFQGDNDPFGTVEQLNVLEKEINADVIVREISNAAHNPHVENNLETIALIETYFNKLVNNKNK